MGDIIIIGGASAGTKPLTNQQSPFGQTVTKSPTPPLAVTSATVPSAGAAAMYRQGPHASDLSPGQGAPGMF